MQRREKVEGVYILIIGTLLLIIGMMIFMPNEPENKKAPAPPQKAAPAKPKTGTIRITRDSDLKESLVGDELTIYLPPAKKLRHLNVQPTNYACFTGNFKAGEVAQTHVFTAKNSVDIQAGRMRIGNTILRKVIVIESLGNQKEPRSFY